jgi:hypothetical protein
MELKKFKRINSNSKEHEKKKDKRILTPERMVYLCFFIWFLIFLNDFVFD